MSDAILETKDVQAVESLVSATSSPVCLTANGSSVYLPSQPKLDGSTLFSREVGSTSLSSSWFPYFDSVESVSSLSAFAASSTICVSISFSSSEVSMGGINVPFLFVFMEHDQPQTCEMMKNSPSGIVEGEHQGMIVQWPPILAFNMYKSGYSCIVFATEFLGFLCDTWSFFYILLFIFGHTFLEIKYCYEDTVCSFI